MEVCLGAVVLGRNRVREGRPSGDQGGIQCQWGLHWRGARAFAGVGDSLRADWGDYPGPLIGFLGVGEVAGYPRISALFPDTTGENTRTE